MTISAEPLRVNDFHIIEYDGWKLLWIIPSSALFSIDERGHTLLRMVMDQRGADFDPDAFSRSAPSDAPEMRADALRELRQLGVLASVTDTQDAGLAKDDVIVTASPPMASVSALVSGGCNIRCPYCYADQGGFGSQGHAMSFEVGRRLIDLQLAESGDLPAVSFQFHGGEPLLNMRVIKRLVAHGEAEASRLRKRIRFGLTTNGMLLTRELIDYVVDHGIAVKISIDGPGEIHDAVRTDRLGRGTYARVIRAVGPLLARRPTPARVTVTRKSLAIVRIVDHLLEVGFAEVGISPVSSADPEYALTADDHAQIMSEYRRLASRVVGAAEHGERYGFANLMNLIRQVHHGRSQSYPCGAGIQLFAADADGILYPCHRFPGQDSTAMGDVENGIDRARQAEWLERLRVDQRGDCSNCWARYICSGGCYYLSTLEYGDSGRAYTPICGHLREWYELGIVTYARLAKECPEALDRLGLSFPDDEFSMRGAAGGTLQAHQQEEP